VTVRSVLDGDRASMTRRTASSPSQARMALPTAVQYAGARLRTREAIVTLRSFSTLSMQSSGSMDVR
jgi:hypothetical protein